MLQTKFIGIAESTSVLFAFAAAAVATAATPTGSASENSILCGIRYKVSLSYEVYDYEKAA